MADKSTPHILEALRRAVAEPAGLPLLGTKNAPGLFPATSAGRLAAQRCKDDGYLRVVRSDSKGKQVQEVGALTDKGLAYLLSQSSPRRVLEDFVRALEERQTLVAELAASAQQWQAGLTELRATVAQVLDALSQGGAPHALNGTATTVGPETDALESSWIVHCLSSWQASGASEDCPLPTLYRQVQAETPALSIGRFHDALRRLKDDGRLYLHPWTGPLYELPEPALALLSGHEIAYYASLKG